MDYIFNPNRDIQAVSQVCLPTLGQIMESGIMPQDAGEPVFNEVENPDAVVGLMRDNFDIADASRISEAISTTVAEPAPPSTPASADSAPAQSE